ncbi:hypothetical protein M422DRAFT_153664, partial [Sphaerobolus stellatus SS14]
NNQQRRRSASPTPRRGGTHTSMNAHGSRERQADTRQDFRSSAGQGNSSYPPCAVCLGRHQHEVAKCCALRTWDGKFATIARKQDKKLLLLSGQMLCYRWQGYSGCPSRAHDEQHLCSGCGSASHGVHKCPRVPRADTL